MKNQNEVPFDSARFCEAAKAHGTTAAQIAREMGVSNAFFAHRGGKYGTLAGRDAIMLERVYGIKPHEYAPRTAESDPTNLRPVLRGVVKDVIDERVSNDEFIKAVQAIIRPAVRAVMVEERAAIIEAVTDAVKAVLE